MLDVATAGAWAIISGDPRVLVPRAEIDAPDEAIESLAAKGLVAVCQWGGDPHLTLTPLSASTLGVRIARRRNGDMEWTTKPPKRKRPREERGVDPSREVDPKAMRPDEIVDINERIDSYASAASSKRRLTDADKSGRNLPRPTVLLTGCRSWVATGWIGPCPACLGRRLRPSVYCLRCDRWGLDWLLARVTPDTGRPAKVAEFRPHGVSA